MIKVIDITKETEGILGKTKTIQWKFTINNIPHVIKLIETSFGGKKIELDGNLI